MIQKSQESVWRDAYINIVFYDEENNGPVATFHERSQVPIPEVGEQIRLREKEGNEEIDYETEAENIYEVEGRRYDYDLVAYEDDGEDVEQLFVTTVVQVTPAENPE